MNTYQMPELTVAGRVTNFSGLHYEPRTASFNCDGAPDVIVHTPGWLRLRVAPFVSNETSRGRGRFTDWFNNLGRSTAVTVELNYEPGVVYEHTDDFRGLPYPGRLLTSIGGLATFDEFPRATIDISVPRMSLHAGEVRELPSGEMQNLAYIVPIAP